MGLSESREDPAPAPAPPPEGAVAALERLNDRGNELYGAGQYLGARAEYERLLGLAEQTGHRQYAGWAHGGLGLVSEVLEDYPRALQCYEAARAVQEEVGDTAGLGTTLGNMGIVHQILGQYPLALKRHGESLAISEQLGDTAGFGNTRHNIAILHQQLGHHRRALECFQEGRRICEQQGDTAGLGKALTGMGAMHQLLGQLQRALECFGQSKAIAQRLGDVSQLGIVLGNIAIVHGLLKEYPRALECYEESIAIKRRLGENQGLSDTLHNMAGCHYRNESSPARLDKAADALSAAFDLKSAMRRRVASMGHPVVLSLNQDHHETAVALQAVLVESGRHTEALRIAEASRAQALDLCAHSTNAGAGEEGRSVLREAGIDWQADLASVPNTVFVVYSIVTQYARLFRHEGHLLCWTIGAGPDLAFSATEASELAALVNLCRGSDLGMRNRASRDLTKGGTPGDVAPDDGVAASEGVLVRLRELLIPPALEELLAGRGFDDDDELNVVFMPTGCLALVPFAALLTPDGTPLIEQCSVATCPSLAHFKKTMARVDGRASVDAGPALLVGNPSPMPVLAGGVGLLNPLPASQAEVEQLQADLATPTVFVGPDATKASFLELVNGGSKASSPCILHLATHGFSSDPSGQVAAEDAWDVQGCLAFADAGATTADSFLLAREVVHWRLPATQLAVLSACNSHVGTFEATKSGVPHDSAAGLSFAFLMAGVPRSLVSLWPVQDDATKELMLHFYRHLKLLNGGGAGKDGVLSVAPFTTARALRLATRDLWRDHPDYKRCHVMWAAFVVSGLP